MLEKWKLRKYKEILFVDSENVGYSLPKSLLPSTFVFMFVSDIHILVKLQTQINKQVKIVDLTRVARNHTKNAMDFCIISQVNQILKYVNKNQKLVIISKDKGYDAAIDFIRENHPNIMLERTSLPLSLVSEDDYYQKIYNKMSAQLKKKVCTYDSMKKLRKKLSKTQKKVFYIEQYVNSISSIQVAIEYDIYKRCFALYHGGGIVKEYQLLEDALKDYEELKDRVEKKYKKYYSKEMYNKAKELKIHKYIEEAYNNHQTLQECLMKHFGQVQGTQLFQSYVYTQ